MKGDLSVYIVCNFKTKLMKTLKSLKLILMSFLLIAFFGCDNDGSGMQNIEVSNINVKLMDMPGEFDNVFIEILDVMVKVNDTTVSENGWLSLEAINTGVYDLLELTGGINVLLVDDYSVPSGTLNQIRLILGENNTVVIDGETFPLNTPSAQQSGLKIKVNEELEPNIAYTFLLDFNVDESIVLAGNSGNINLKPVIRATVEAQTGTISGSVIPADVQTEISATNGIDVISAYANDTGDFVLVGLSEGIYTVTITPDVASGLLPQVIENVEVSVGATTDIGFIELE